MSGTITHTFKLDLDRTSSFCFGLGQSEDSDRSCTDGWQDGWMDGRMDEEAILLFLRRAFCGIASKNKFELHELVYNVYHRGVCPKSCFIFSTF